jgi:hypothetical protein
MFHKRIFCLFVLVTFICLQSQSLTAGKITSAKKVFDTMWEAIKGNPESDGSSDARFGLLLAKQFLTMGQIDIAENGELYINGTLIKDVNAGALYIDQHAELMSPVFIQSGGYAAFNQILQEKSKAGVIVISQHMESRGLLTVGHGAKIEANVIKVVNDIRGRR